MVQVDVFFSYAIGSSFALAAFRQLRKVHAESGVEQMRLDRKDVLRVRRLVRELGDKQAPAFNNEYFMKTLLFLSLVFVPSGAVLLWSHPSWETMHECRHETIPPWFVAAFSISNVTQGILGYWVTYNLLMRGKYLRASHQAFFAYLGMFFMLVNGWDKTGYQRLFSATREDFENWEWSNVLSWLTSDVVKLLISIGVVFMPLMNYWIIKWFMEGYEMEEGEGTEHDTRERLINAIKLGVLAYVSIIGIAFGSATLATLLIKWLGWTKGLVTFGATLYLGILSKWGIGPALIKKIMRVESLEAPSVWEQGP